MRDFTIMLSVSLLVINNGGSDRILTFDSRLLSHIFLPVAGTVGSTTMAAAEQPPHLTQQELSPGDMEILAGLTDWLSHASFNPATNRCTDKEVEAIWTSTLCRMDFLRKVIEQHGLLLLIFLT